MEGRAKQIFNTARGGLAHFITERPAAALLVAVALVAFVFLVWQFGGAVVSGFRSAATSREVQATEAQATEVQTEAGAQLGAANETSIERRVNDRVREQTITPELERTQRASLAARERTNKAGANYEAAQKTIFGGGVDDRALHDRNCTDLRQLYPGQRFARCQ